MEKIKKSYKSNRFKISAPTWSEELELPDGSYSISDVQNYFEYIFKKHEEETVNLSITIYINEIENRITFKIKTGYYLELLTPETTELLGSTKIKIKKDGNDENVPPLEISEVLLIHCLIVNINYQQCSKVMYTSVPNKSFVQLLDISPENFIFSKTFDSEFSYCEVCFTDQNSKPLAIKDKST